MINGGIMAPYDSKKPDPIGLYKKQYDKAKKLITTTHSAHSEAYTTAQNKVLKDKDGLIDVSLLDKEENQDKFLDTMIDFYLDKAVKSLNIKEKPKDAVDQDRILRAYANVSRTELQRYIKTHGKDYTLDKHEGIRDELMKKIRSDLIASAGGHLRDKHVKALIKEMKLDDIVDASKLQIDDAMDLFNFYDMKNRSPISHEDIRSYHRQLNRQAPTYLKPEKPVKKAA
jgi:hypothetical protein